MTGPVPSGVYVAFLRAINLGARRKFPMAELRDCLTEAGASEVETHINTGNVRLSLPLGSPAEVEAELERIFAGRTGFDVPTMVRTPEEVVGTAGSAADLAGDVERRYVCFLKHPLSSAEVEAIDGWDQPGEGARVLGSRREVVWWLDHPTQAARLSNAVLERRTGPATTRDLKVVTALARKWGR